MVCSLFSPSALITHLTFGTEISRLFLFHPRYFQALSQLLLVEPLPTWWQHNEAHQSTMNAWSRFVLKCLIHAAITASTCLIAYIRPFRSQSASAEQLHPLSSYSQLLNIERLFFACHALLFQFAHFLPSVSFSCVCFLPVGHTTITNHPVLCCTALASTGGSSVVNSDVSGSTALLARDCKYFRATRCLVAAVAVSAD